jgi:hypothetical protein
MEERLILLILPEFAGILSRDEIFLKLIDNNKTGYSNEYPALITRLINPYLN